MPKDRGSAKDSRQKAWQVVNDGEGKRVERMRVPGGWLYAVTAVDGDARHLASVVFIPLQERGKEVAAPAGDPNDKAETPGTDP